MLVADCVRASLSAAALTLPQSATASNTANCFNEYRTAFPMCSVIEQLVYAQAVSFYWLSFLYQYN
ncbi:hypothetical protein KKIDH5335_42390 [Vibrio fluvialis]|nr:hypothetical protein KKIDH5335_42390 [Vibrio fluvialis]